MTKHSKKNGLKIRGKKSKSIILNLPIELIKELTKISDNSNNKDKILNIYDITPEDIRKGIYQAIGAWKILNKDPRKLLFSDINILTDHAKLSGLANHYEHYEKCKVADFLVYWVNTGKVNPNILQAPNKAIDDFEDDKEKK